MSVRVNGATGSTVLYCMYTTMCYGSSIAAFASRASVRAIAPLELVASGLTVEAGVAAAVTLGVTSGVADFSA